jgi:hypothetical protein
MNENSKPKRGGQIGNKNAAKKPAEKLVQIGVKVRQDQPEKFKALGGSKWLRGAIDAGKKAT